MNSDRNHRFLFSLAGLRSADSARKVTIRRVYDVCMRSLCLGEVERAKKAFGILLRCREFDWKDSWSLAIYMLNAHDPEREDAFFLSQVEQLRSLMLQDPTRVGYSLSARARTELIPQREELLNEVLQVLIQNGRYTEALDEIELCVALNLYDAPSHSCILFPGISRHFHTRTILSFTSTLDQSACICLKIPTAGKTKNLPKAFSKKPRPTSTVWL